MKQFFFACIAGLFLALPAAAQPRGAEGGMASLEALFAQLSQADDSNWQALERAIEDRWAQSGSAAMDLLLDRARRALDDNDLDAAFEHLGALTDHAPEFAEGWHLRATAFFRAGRLGLALSDLERVLALEPRHFDALEGVGVIMEELNRPERAIAAYRHVLAIHPQNPDVKEALARLENGQSAEL